MKNIDFDIQQKLENRIRYQRFAVSKTLFAEHTHTNRLGMEKCFLKT